MFVLEAQAEFAHFARADWAFVGCASFEDRWLGFANVARSLGSAPARSLILYPIDTGSAHQAECSRRQEESWTPSFVRNEWRSQRIDVELLGSAPWRLVRDSLESTFQTDAPRALIIDVTTMPRICMFSAVEWALRRAAIDDLAIMYSEPASYGGGPLHSEPTGPTVVPPFDHLPATSGGRREVSWIPILGFGPTFAKNIFEAISGDYDLGHSIYPIIGFPAFDPTFFERCVADSAGVFESAGITHTQFRYASASDPFETREVILKLVGGTPAGHLWIGSPMGPKPMSVGMMLAAIDRPMTIMIDQARTYHPDYSRGVRRVHMYILRHRGRRTY